MQHTPKYALNLIDPSDEFLPDPLNQNMETVETQLQAREAAEAALDTKFSAAIGSGGKNARIAWGSYVGTGESGKEHPSTLTFDFKPHLVLVSCSEGAMGPRWFLRPVLENNFMEFTWGENSVTWIARSSEANINRDQYNLAGTDYYWAAIGESLD